MDPLAALPWRSRAPLLQPETDEKLLRRSHGHWVQHALPAFVAVLLSGAGMAFLAAAVFMSVSAVVAQVLLLLASVVVLPTLHWFFHYALSESVSEILLTNKRILRLDRRLWWYDAVDETVLARIKAVHVHKSGLLRQVFDYGDLVFDIGGGKNLDYLPHPKGWAEDIQRQIR